jgi:hypothetical protein
MPPITTLAVFDWLPGSLGGSTLALASPQLTNTKLYTMISKPAQNLIIIIDQSFASINAFKNESF